MPRTSKLHPRISLRAVKYFRPDASLIVALLTIIAVSTLLGLLQVWPMAILIDAVLTPQAQSGCVIWQRMLAIHYQRYRQPSA